MSPWLGCDSKIWSMRLLGVPPWKYEQMGWVAASDATGDRRELAAAHPPSPRRGPVCPDQLLLKSPPIRAMFLRAAPDVAPRPRCRRAVL